MVLYEVQGWCDGESYRRAFRSKREATKAARAWMKDCREGRVEVTKLVLPPPSVELVMSIFNEAGYAIEQIEILKLERN